MADELEGELLKKAFQKVDKRGTGSFARADLAKVFKDLDSSWTMEDLNEMFDSVQPNKDGTVNYTALIDWIMDDDEPDADDEDGEEDDDDDDADAVESKEVPMESNMSLDERVTEAEFPEVLRRLDMDVNEASDIYNSVAREAMQANLDVQHGIKVKWFLDELNIDRGDKEAIHYLAQAIEEVRKHSSHTCSGDHALEIAADRLSKVLQKEGRPAEDAWAVMQHADHVSHAGRKAISAKYRDNKDGLVQLIKQYALSPPMLPSSAGQTGNRECCTAKVEQIIRRCRTSQEKFIDSEFDLESQTAACLYVDKERPGWDCTVAVPAAFKRVSEIASNPVLFKGGIQAGDIKQGQIGTCFLLGGLGAVAANKKEVIRRCFICYSIEHGVYGVRFCVNGEWEHVIVDDVMPVDKYGRILYARSADPDEVWCPILEKAYCKLHKCYEMCDGGRPNQAIFSLCGGASGKFAIDDKHRQDPKAYFKILKNARDRGWLLTTTFVITKTAKAGAGKCGEAVLPTGLVGGHVYSVLLVMDVCGQKLVQCRNPWGTGEWKGKFSDENKYGEWTAELKAATGWTGKNDGKFWMSIDDFVVNSGGVEYARTFGPQWKKITHQTQFQRGSLQATTMWPYTAREGNEIGFAKGATVEVININPGWWYGNVLGSADKKGYFPGNYVKLKDRPVARFDLTGTPAAGCRGVSVVVMLMQPNSKMQRKFYKRKKDGLNYKDVTYPSIQLVVVGPDGKVALKRAGKKRCVSGELFLPGGGLWKIYALSLDGRGSDFSLRTYIKDGSANVVQVEGASISEITKVISG
mmetsp:Transcript_113153/g.283225  ORF Transcript_113153/g.283225 Transcript_113153/m.283225 type:complete len:806 (-) Transcript_113153:53-2470(-)